DVVQEWGLFDQQLGRSTGGMAGDAVQFAEQDVAVRAFPAGDDARRLRGGCGASQVPCQQRDGEITWCWKVVPSHECLGNRWGSGSRSARGSRAEECMEAACATERRDPSNRELV